MSYVKGLNFNAMRNFRLVVDFTGQEGVEFGTKLNNFKDFMTLNFLRIFGFWLFLCLVM